MGNELVVTGAGAVTVHDGGSGVADIGDVSRETQAAPAAGTAFAEVEQRLRGEFAALGIDAAKYDQVKALLKAHLPKLQSARETHLQAERAAQDRTTRIEEISRLMRAPQGSEDYRRYWHDPAVQREYRELLNAEVLK